jgi:hypothetical protein
MIRQAVIFLLVPFKYFPLLGLLNAGYGISAVAIFQVTPMNAEKIFMMADILHINRVEIAFAE